MPTVNMRIHYRRPDPYAWYAANIDESTANCWITRLSGEDAAVYIEVENSEPQPAVIEWSPIGESNVED